MLGTHTFIQSCTVPYQTNHHEGKVRLYNVQGVTGEPSFMHLPSPIAIPWSLYFINICFFSLIIYRVHRAAANDKNRTETTSSKLADFICSLTRKFKAGTGLNLTYGPRVLLSMSSHTIYKLSWHDQKDAHWLISPVPDSYQF